MESWTQREKLNETYNVSPENAGTSRNWNVNAGAQTVNKPQGAIATDVHMDHAVRSLFLNKAERIASSRHGGIYDVIGNFANVYGILTRDANAFVQGYGFPGGQNVRFLVKVTRTTPSKEWNAWLRFRVREAKMHRAVYAKLGAVSKCLFVPMPFFAGVDYSTGLYYSIMQRPLGSLVPISQLIKANKFTMHTYRSIEAAVASIWRVGAMLTDTSEGNVLVSSKGFVTIVDFDSSIVLPPEIATRMTSNINTLWGGHKHDACYRISNSKEADLVKMFNFVTRQQSDMPMLKRLTINVYGRSSWFPDVNMLTLLFQAAEASTPSRGKRGLRASWFKPVKKFFKPLRQDDGFELPSIRVRRMGALPEGEKEAWRPRKHRSHTGSRTGSHDTRRSVNVLPRTMTRQWNNGENIRSLRIPAPTAHVQVESSTIPMPQLAQGTASSVGLPVISPNVARLVATSGQGASGIFSNPVNFNSRGNGGANGRNARNGGNGGNGGNVNRSKGKSEEFRDFKSLSKARKEVLIEQEVSRVKNLNKLYTQLKSKLRGDEKFGGTSVLNNAIRQRFPDMGWSKLTDAGKRRTREKYLDEIAADILEAVVRKVLEMSLEFEEDRNDQIQSALNQKFSTLNILWRVSGK